MTWLTLKTKLIGLGVLLLTALAYVANHRRVVNKLEKTKIKLNSAKAEVRVQKQVNSLDNDVHDEIGLRRVQARKEIESGERPENIKNPNDF